MQTPAEIDTLLIAHDGQTNINGFATKLGDTVCAIISANTWARQYAAKRVILTLCRDNIWNTLWTKFISDYAVHVIYHDPDPDSGAKYARFDSIRAAREINGIKFDVYRELYARLDGGMRQNALCGSERGLGRTHIFEYYHWGQEDPVIPTSVWQIDNTVVSVPDVARSPRVLIAPVAFSQGNHVFNAEFWNSVHENLTRCGIPVALNTNISPDDLLGHVAKHALVCCGNTGMGWLAAVTNTPFIACEPHDSQLYDYRYELFKPPALIDIIDEPDPGRMVAAVRAAMHFITQDKLNPALITLRANEVARRGGNKDQHMSETVKAKERREREGFFTKYISGDGIDIGCGRTYGYSDESRVHPSAIAHDKDICDAHDMVVYGDESFDYVYNSHVLEHLEHPILAIKNWYRICKFDGFLIIVVPSMYLYEKKRHLPSKWNADHKRFYTIAALSAEIEQALEPNSYIVEYIKDCADGFNWDLNPTMHSDGEYQIECVLRKIRKPSWAVE
jgi:SAM-dependent methyltransferase